MEVIYDDEKMRFEVKGPSSNDTLLVEHADLMQKTDMKVHCQVAAIGVSDQVFERLGYVKETGLYNRLLIEYERKTGKIAKRW